MLKKSPFDMEKKDSPGNSRGELKAFLGEGTDFKGVLAFEGTVRIDGKLEGEIITDDTLIVGERAIVNAEINVGCIAISGKITGNITAKERIDIHSSGEVYGNIQTPILTIEEGVIFQGHCEMRNPEEKKIPYVVKKEEKVPDAAISPGRKEKMKSMSQLLTEEPGEIQQEQRV
jgi:cytoskeletal protein CcmA (bactofilin family)